MNHESHTLTARLAEGPIETTQALTYAAQLGDALRQMHLQGTPHGALTPSAVVLNGVGAQLLPAPSAEEDRSHYLAPEITEGQSPDACSDIYSFGAILYQMLTGRPVAQPLPPVGNAAVDRVVNTCLCANRAARYQRMQHVLMELRLLSGAERRAEADTQLRRKEIDSILHERAQQLESRWNSRFEQMESAAATDRAALRDACDALSAVRSQLSDMTGVLAAAHEGIERLNLTVDETRANAVESRQTTSRVRDLEQTLRAQAIAIEMNANGMVRIDDLVERVVEALESLQSLVLENSEDKVAVVKVA